MADRDDLLKAWGAASGDLTMLPSGVEVRLDIPSVASLIATGAMPTALRGLALQFMGEDGVDPSSLDDDEQQKWQALERLLIAAAVVAIKPPGFDQPQPFRIKVEDLELDPTPFPRHDLIALRDIVLRIRTAKQVDALSRVGYMQQELDDARERRASAEEIDEIEKRIVAKAEWAASVVQAERVNTIEGWTGFRRGRGSLADLARSANVGQPTVKPSDHLGPGGRPRTRRSTRRSADGSPAGPQA